MRRGAHDTADAQAAVEARKKLAQAQRDTAWIADVAAPQLARLPTDQFVDRVRDAMTLVMHHRGQSS
jgi:hypothetical protein